MKKSNESLFESTNSYMDLRLHTKDGIVLQLKVPTFWDSVQEMWMGALILPNSQQIIKAFGKNSFELQNSFNKEVSKVFAKQDKAAEELFSMFEKL